MYDHTKRPPMLKMLSRPAKPPPTAALTPNMAEHIFDACPRMPMPALTFMHSTTQRHQNCGVFHARSTPTLALVIIGLRYFSGSQPSGFQPGGGTRTTNAPNNM